jgi:hypothetical protein
MAIKTPKGKAMQRASNDVVAVPIKNGKAPNRWRLASQIAFVKNPRPVF